MKHRIKTVTIIGANGNMGWKIGALLAARGMKVFMLARQKEKAIFGCENAIRNNRSLSLTRALVPGTYEDDLTTSLNKSQWVIECLTENIYTKNSMYDILEAFLPKGVFISSMTSSLSLKELTRDRGENFKRNFSAMHLFNPPNILHACEFAVTKDADTAMTEELISFIIEHIKLKVVRVKNVSAFIGNRLAMLNLSLISDLVQKYGVRQTDYIFGNCLGRKMPPLITLDYIGLDVYCSSIKILKDSLENDRKKDFVIPEYLDLMIDREQLGIKTKETGGFYLKISRDEYLTIDIKTGKHTKDFINKISFVERAKALIKIGDYRGALGSVMKDESEPSFFVKRVIADYISYAFFLAENVSASESIHAVDTIMENGFAWTSPSDMIKLLGGVDKVKRLFSFVNVEPPHDFEARAKCFDNYADVGKYFITRKD